MARYAIIRSGIVENVCQWDGDTAKWTPPKNTIAVLTTSGEISNTYDGSTFEAVVQAATRPNRFNTNVSIGLLGGAAMTEKNFTVSGLKIGDRILVRFTGTPPSGVFVANCYVPSDDTLALRFGNIAALSITPAGTIPIEIDILP